MTIQNVWLRVAMKHSVLSMLTAITIALVPLWCRAAVTEKILHSFSGCGAYYCTAGDRDGLDPMSSLVADSAGNLYGTTQYGGNFAGKTGCYPATCSTVFELSRAGTGWKKTTIYYFQGVYPKGVSDGSYTTAGLLFYKGALYGTTYQGGSGSHCTGGCGTVYRLTPPAAGHTLWNEQILWNFSGYNDASEPYSSLIVDASGALYGTYRGDNTLFPNGTGLGGVFKLTPPASGKGVWTERVISTFGAGAYGEQPVAGLISDTSGNLYGVVTGNVFQGVPSTIFKLEPQNVIRTVWKTVVLHTFSVAGPEGSYPVGGVVMDAKGNLFATTSVGAGTGCVYNIGCGTVFELSPGASVNASRKVRVLHTFTGGADGGNSYAGLTIDTSGNLYGTTRSGGSTVNNSYGSGVVFEISSGGTFTVLHTFLGWCCNTIYAHPNHDGENPYTTPLLWDGALFGSTALGGTYDRGAVYELSP